MTPERFEALREEFLTHEAGDLDGKRGEYSPNVDVLGFYREVSELRRTPAEVALAYTSLMLIQEIVRAVKTGKYAWAWETEDGEGLKQCIADARNFLLLLAACLEEENEHVREEEGTT